MNPDSQILGTLMGAKDRHSPVDTLVVTHVERQAAALTHNGVPGEATRDSFDDEPIDIGALELLEAIGLQAIQNFRRLAIG